MTEKTLTLKKPRLTLEQAKKYGPSETKILAKTYIHKGNGGLTVTLEETTPKIETFKDGEEYYTEDLRLCFDYFGIWKTAFPLSTESLRQIAFSLMEGAEKATFKPSKCMKGSQDDYSSRGTLFHFKENQLARRRVILENELRYLEALENMFHELGQGESPNDNVELDQPGFSMMGPRSVADFLMGKKPPEYPPFPKDKFKKVPVLKYG